MRYSIYAYVCRAYIEGLNLEQIARVFLISEQEVNRIIREKLNENTNTTSSSATLPAWSGQ